MPCCTPLAYDSTYGEGAVQVVELDPILIDDPRLLGVDLGNPYDRPAARWRQHQKIIGLGGVDRKPTIDLDIGDSPRR